MVIRKLEEDFSAAQTAEAPLEAPFSEGKHPRWSARSRWFARGSLGALSFSLTLLSGPLQAEANTYDSAAEPEELSIQVRAFLDTIAWAEGTAGPYGYQTAFTGAYFDSLSDHPRRVRCAPYRRRRLCSSASGRYQFLSTTWDRVANRLQLQDFSPLSQDLAAVELIREKGALEDIEAGRWQTAIHKVAPVWASLPSLSTGRSVYGQPSKSLRQLQSVYAFNLDRYYQLVMREPVALRVPSGGRVPVNAPPTARATAADLLAAQQTARPVNPRIPAPAPPTVFPPSRVQIAATAPAQSVWPSVFAETPYQTGRSNPRETSSALPDLEEGVGLPQPSGASGAGYQSSLATGQGS